MWTKNIKTNTNSTKCAILTVLLKLGVNSRDTENIGEQVKKQTKNINKTDPRLKTGVGLKQGAHEGQTVPPIDNLVRDSGK